jgi:hypothetical protein
LFQSFFVERIPFIPVRQVYATCYLQTSVFLPQWIKSDERSHGALLTAWGKADETADGKMLIVWIGCWRLIGCSAGPFG